MSLFTLGMSINGLALAIVMVGGGNDISMPADNDSNYPGIPDFELPGGISELGPCNADDALGLSRVVVQTIAGINGYGSATPTKALVENGRHNSYLADIVFGSVEGKPQFRVRVAAVPRASGVYGNFGPKCEIQTIWYLDEFQLTLGVYRDYPVEGCDREMAMNRAALVGETISIANGYYVDPSQVTARLDSYNGTTSVRFEHDLDDRTPAHTVRILASCRVGSVSFENRKR